MSNQQIQSYMNLRLRIKFSFFFIFNFYHFGHLLLTKLSIIANAADGLSVGTIWPALYIVA